MTIDLKMDGDTVTDFAHDVKACALGQASSSIMARNVVGAKAGELRDLRENVRRMLKENGAPPSGKWADIAVLEPVRDYKARHASTMLTFDAVVSAIDQIEEAAPRQHRRGITVRKSIVRSAFTRPACVVARRGGAGCGELRQVRGTPVLPIRIVVAALSALDVVTVSERLPFSASALISAAGTTPLADDTRATRCSLRPDDAIASGACLLADADFDSPQRFGRRAADRGMARLVIGDDIFRRLRAAGDA